MFVIETDARRLLHQDVRQKPAGHSHVVVLDQAHPGDQHWGGRIFHLGQSVQGINLIHDGGGWFRLGLLSPDFWRFVASILKGDSIPRSV